MRTYGFVDWSGNAGIKFGLGSSSHLAVALVSSDDGDAMRQILLGKRAELGRPRDFEFHFARNSDVTRTVFFSSLSQFAWDGAVLLLDKRESPAELAKMREPVFYGFCLGRLLVRVPASLVDIKRLLIDGEKKDQVLVRAMRLAMSDALRARGVARMPALRAEPAHQWDGLQLADMVAGVALEREMGGKDYLREQAARLRIYKYQVVN